jgi:hypothetical protein
MCVGQPTRPGATSEKARVDLDLCQVRELAVIPEALSVLYAIFNSVLEEIRRFWKLLITKEAYKYIGLSQFSYETNLRS